MKIVDRATFLALPAGTVFTKYQPANLGAPAIKGETVAGVDFVVQPLDPWFLGARGSEGYIDILFAMQGGQASPPVDYDCGGRDGLFDQDQLFAVWDRADLEALIARLQRALAEGYPP
jgi:hypothetical protein